MNNIWEIVTLTDLIKKLKETDGFSIIAITLESTPLSIVKVIKKFLKTYSKKYPNMTFLYYRANVKDLGRTTLLNTNQDEYPFVYHIYNNLEDIFVTVNRANNNTIYEAFNAVEDYYKKDLLEYIEKKETINNTNNTNNTSTNNTNNTSTNNTNNTSSTNTMNSNSELDEQRAEMERKSLEHQKLLEKLVLFDEKKKNYNIKFLSDIQKRKKDEQKL